MAIQLTGIRVTPLVNGTSQSAGPIQGNLAVASASINLATGQLRASIQGRTSPFGSEVSWVYGFEYLSFDRAATISWEFSLDGQLSNTGSLGPGAGVGFNVWDVTGLTEAEVFVDNYLGSGLRLWRDGVPYVGGNSLSYQMVGSPNAPYDFTDEVKIVSSNGVPVAVNDVLRGSFDVTSGRTYLIMPNLYVSLVNTDGFASANFSNTASLRFTDTGGATFDSLSGVFLSQTTPVPEPTLLVPSGLGLLAMYWRTRRQGRSA